MGDKEKIVVFMPYGVGSPAFETCLEIMQIHIDRNDEIIFLGCNGSMSACDRNINHVLGICLLCNGKQRRGLRLLSKKIKHNDFLNLLEADKKNIVHLKTNHMNIDDLKRYYLNDFDIGYGVASSIISAANDVNPELSIYRKQVSRLLMSCYKVYRSLINYLKSHKVDRVYVFNSRYGPMRAAFRACLHMKVDCHVFERGGNLDNYETYINKMPHDLIYREKLIKSAWHNSLNKNKKQIASEFYHARSKNCDPRTVYFTKNQETDLLPEKWDNNKNNVVIFGSSGFEFAAVNDLWKNKIYNSQEEGIEKIVQSMSQYADRYHVYLRMHPNLPGVVNKDEEDIFTIAAKNFTIVPPDSPISTYALVKAADKIVTFGSTVGIEAVFWGTPSVLAGPCFYQNLGSIYKPQGHDELIKMLLADIPMKDKEGALMFGYYFATFGKRYKYYRPMEFFHGEFKGQVIKPFYFMRIIIALLMRNKVRWIMNKMRIN